MKTFVAFILFAAAVALVSAEETAKVEQQTEDVAKVENAAVQAAVPVKTEDTSASIDPSKVAAEGTGQTRDKRLILKKLALAKVGLGIAGLGVAKGLYLGGGGYYGGHYGGHYGGYGGHYHSYPVYYHQHHHHYPEYHTHYDHGYGHGGYGHGYGGYGYGGGIAIGGGYGYGGGW